MIKSESEYWSSRIEDKFCILNDRNLEVQKKLRRIKIAGGISYSMWGFLNASVWNYLNPPSHVYIADGVHETDLSIRKSREYEEKVRSPNNI